MSNSSSSQKGVQVFLSYGRRDASNFVERLAKDLSDAGHRVWRDISDLEVPRSWDTQLSRAIDNSDVLVAVLTPHAVRTAKEEIGLPGRISGCAISQSTDPNHSGHADYLRTALCHL